MEDLLEMCDSLPGGAAPANNDSQIMWADQIGLQQVQTDSSTEALQTGTRMTGSFCQAGYPVRLLGTSAGLGLKRDT